MNETARAIISAGITLGGGMLTFVAGQIFLKFMDTAIELRTLIAEIEADLTLYVSNQKDALDEDCCRIFRRQGGRLKHMVWRVIWYSCFKKLFRLPPREDVLAAAASLSELATTHDIDTDDYIYKMEFAWQQEDEIRELLQL